MVGQSDIIDCRFPSSSIDGVMATITVTAPKAAVSLPPPSRYQTIDHLLRQYASDGGETPMFGYPAKGASDYEIHTVRMIDQYVDAACWWYQAQGLLPIDPAQEKAPAIALLTQSSLDAIISFLALGRMGWAVLFLSTRLPAPALVSLMRLTDCTTIVASAVFDAVIQQKHVELQFDLLPLIKQVDYRLTLNVQQFVREVDPKKESEKVAWIIHSSGSTGFPKPIFVTNIGALSNFRTGLSLRVFTISPLFHSHALFAFGRALYHRQIMFFGNHQLPVTRPNLVAALRVAKPELVWAVPYVLEILAERDDGIAELAKAKTIIYGGSACPDSLGDKLVSKGVKLVGSYGATEMGFVMNSARPAGDDEWNYMRLNKPVADHIWMDEISPGLFECIVLDGLPTKVATNTDNPPGAFRTRDLFTRHPDPAKSNHWKHVSRLDDRLTLVNGEKVLPIPIEGHIRQSVLVREVAVFGFQRALPGAIVFRSEAAVNLSDEEFLDQIWPQIEEANGRAETFSRISRDLVIVRPFDESYPRTDKGTFIRAQLYEQYQSHMQQAYERFEAGVSTSTNERHLLNLDVPALEEFLMAKFRDDLGVTLDSVDSDIFSAGVDSLQTTRILHMIKKELDLGGNEAKLSQNVVFERGTCRSLAQHLYRLRLDIGDCEDDSDWREIQEMQDLIRSYSNFTTHDPTDRPKVSSKTVLLTGTTGGLGSCLLANLLRRQDISRVYCLVRASDAASAQTRVLRALEDRGLQRELPDNHQNKVCFCGRPEPAFACAWAVNFNLPLHAFDQQHIRGVYNLLEHVALRTTHSKPAKFFFCSSVAAVSGTPKDETIAEARVSDLSHAQPIGTGCVARVLRIGQLAGDTRQAVWNDTEAIALMIRSALPSSASCLPSLDESPSWLPIDRAAEAIEQLAFRNDDAVDAELVYHIVNPCTFSFAKDLVPMLQAHPSMPSFEVDDVAIWLDRLRASDEDVERDPSRKLMGFWERKYVKASTPDEPAPGNAEDIGEKGPRFETTKTIKDSTVLGEVRDPVGDGLMYRTVDVWTKKWKIDLEIIVHQASSPKDILEQRRHPSLQYDLHHPKGLQSNMDKVMSRHSCTDSTSNEPTRVPTGASGCTAKNTSSRSNHPIPDLSDETLTSRSSKPIHLEPPPVVVRPPKVKTDSFSHHALTWFAWNRNEHKDISHCARSTRRIYTLEKTLRLFGVTLSQNIAFKTNETGVDIARVNVRLGWQGTERTWTEDKLPQARKRMQTYTQRPDDPKSTERDNNDAGSRPEDIERQTAPTDLTQVPTIAHPWLHDYHYIVVGFMGDGSVPRETLRRVMDTEGLFQAIRKAHRTLRNPLRRALSLKEVSGFGIYECDPAKGYHREVELDHETGRALSELWRSYKGNKLDYEGRWLMWIHEHFNADSNNPEMGGLTLEFKLRWSVVKVVFWGTVPIVLSLVIGFWYMYSDHGDVDDVAVAEAAWVIATYIVTSSALLLALLAVITQLGNI
ncbi:hypothetical protein EDD37DRAFT_607373 [Exophiala viscosa]|uniref:Carrier domain-containing protein n=1 Tax=Exophiala viscosa TaxID=2486360 RepID=A0AAN6ICS7_9EURO|nr:hypothetical protein EDD36DRAFT_418873 [Exophiala viscosa]KAI1625785.1 hypothetical protein EDD37DRAFT_607373 [Exophiala viscosa]